MAASDPLASLVVRFLAESQPFLAGIQEMEAATQKTVNRIAEIGKGLVSAIPLAAIAGEAFHVAESFENATARIARATGAQGDALKALEEDFKSVFAQSALSAESLSSGLAVLAQRSGATGEDLRQLTLVNAQLAKVTGTDLATSVEASQKAFHAWGVTVAEQPAKLDQMLVLSQKTGISVAALSGGLQQAAPVLRNLGFGFEQTAALMASFEQHGISTERLVAALKLGLVSFAKEGIQNPQAAMQQFIQRLVDAKNPLEAVNLAAETFGKRGGVFFADAARQGAFDITALSKAAQDSQGTIASTAEKTQTLADKMTILGHQAELALEPLGKPLVAALTDAVSAITPVLKAIGDATTKFTEFNPKLVELIAGLVAAGPVLILSAKYFTSLAEAIALLRIPAALSFSIAGAPLAPFIAALLATAGGIDSLKTKYDDFAQEAQNQKIFDAVKAGATLEGLEKMGFSIEQVRKAFNGLFIDAGKGFETSFAGIKLLTDGLQGTAAAAGVTAQEFKKALAELGIKDVAGETLKLNEAFSILSRSGKLTGDQLSAAFDALKLKIAELRANIGDDPFKVLGVTPAAHLDVLALALADVEKRFLAGKATMEDLVRAQDAYNKSLEKFNAILPLTNPGAEKFNKILGDIMANELEFADLNANIFADTLPHLSAELTKATGGFDLLGSVAGKTGAVLKELAEASVTPFAKLQADLKDQVAVQQAVLDQMIALKFAAEDVAAQFGRVEAAKAALANAGPLQALGIQSQAALRAFADAAVKNFETVRDSGTATAVDIDKAWLVAANEMIKSGQDLSASSAVEFLKIERSLSQLNPIFRSVVAVNAEVVRGIQGISAALTDSILHTKSWADAFTQAGTTIARDILDGLINKELQKSAVLIDSMVVKLGQFLHLIPAGGLSLPGATTPPFAGGGIPGIDLGQGSVGGGGGGAAGSAVGAVTSGLTGILTSVFTGISAVTGIIGIFQAAHQENTLKSIELNTRQTAIILGTNGAETVFAYTKASWANLNTLVSYFTGAFAELVLKSTSDLDGIGADIHTLALKATGGILPNAAPVVAQSAAPESIGVALAAASSQLRNGLGALNVAPSVAQAPSPFKGDVHFHIDGAQNVDEIMRAIAVRLKRGGLQFAAS